MRQSSYQCAEHQKIVFLSKAVAYGQILADITMQFILRTRTYGYTLLLGTVLRDLVTKERMDPEIPDNEERGWQTPAIGPANYGLSSISGNPPAAFPAEEQSQTTSATMYLKDCKRNVPTITDNAQNYVWNFWIFWYFEERFGGSVRGA